MHEKKRLPVRLSEGGDEASTAAILMVALLLMIVVGVALFFATDSLFSSFPGF